jgi:hypothetical protein
MAVIYFYNAITGKWEPITASSGGGTPGPKGDKGDKGDKGESVEVLVQNTQPAGAKLGTVWINNNP